MYRTLCFASIIVVLAVSAFANTACTAGNLSTVEFSTCSIGELTFTFTGLDSKLFAYDYISQTFTYYSAPTASDFEFTPVAEGFKLSFLPGPQSVVGPATGYITEYSTLWFSVTDSGGGIVQAFISGNTSSFSVSGSNYAFGNDNITVTQFFPPTGGQTSAGNSLQESGGTIVSSPFLIFAADPYVTSGIGGATPFSIFAQIGDSAGWNGTDTTFTFETTNPVPEPSTVVLLGTGLVALGSRFPRRLL